MSIVTMDVESVRSARSERSDRSKRSKRVHLSSNNVTNKRHTSSEERYPLNPRSPAQQQLNHGGNTGGPYQQCPPSIPNPQPGVPTVPCPMYNWMSPGSGSVHMTPNMPLAYHQQPGSHLTTSGASGYSPVAWTTAHAVGYSHHMQQQQQPVGPSPQQSSYVMGHAPSNMSNLHFSPQCGVLQPGQQQQLQQQQQQLTGVALDHFYPTNVYLPPPAGGQIMINDFMQSQPQMQAPTPQPLMTPHQHQQAVAAPQQLMSSSRPASSRHASGTDICTLQPDHSDVVGQQKQHQHSYDSRISQNQPHHHHHHNQQDETAWIEEATAVTGATSETGLSGTDNVSRFGARYGLAASLVSAGLQSGHGYSISGAAAALIRSEVDVITRWSCSHICGQIINGLLGLAALLSPILMLSLPRLSFVSKLGWSLVAFETCEPSCEGHLIGISIKLALLAVAIWFLTAPFRALFTGGSDSLLPRIRLYRTLFLCLVFVVLFAFWLFYTVRVVQPREDEPIVEAGEPSYLSIVVFAGSLTDTLLFLYYGGIGLVELRRLKHRFAIHIVRSPDGMSKTYKCGDVSLQHAVLEVLQFYVTEFPADTPNPLQSSGYGNKRQRCRPLDATGSGAGAGGASKFKFYDVDSAAKGKQETAGGAGGYHLGGDGPGNGTGPTPSASARLYEEVEWEKRIRKRRMRLLLAVEEAFTHVRRLANQSSSCAEQTKLPLVNQSNGLAPRDSKSPIEKSLDPYEAAQAVFPTLIRPLQKYMRATRQQARHPVDMVIDHLALCLAYGLSPLAFLERFNPSTATPQLDAAAAATAIVTAKKDRRQQTSSNNVRQVHRRQRKPSDSHQPQSPVNEANGVPLGAPLLPSRVEPGGQQTWSIVADRALSRGLSDGIVFQLRRGRELSLLCTVRRLPLIRLVEEALEPLEAGRFSINIDNAV